MKKREELLKKSKDGVIKEIEVTVDSEVGSAVCKAKYSPEANHFRDDFFMPEDFDLIH